MYTTFHFTIKSFPGDADSNIHVIPTGLWHMSSVCNSVRLKYLAKCTTGTLTFACYDQPQNSTCCIYLQPNCSVGPAKEENKKYQYSFIDKVCLHTHSEMTRHCWPLSSPQMPGGCTA